MNKNDKRVSIPALLKDCKEPSNLLLHLIYMRRHDPLQTKELWAQQKGATKWSLASMGVNLQKLEQARLAIHEDAGWIVGPAFDSKEDPKAAELARMLVENYDKPRIVEKVTDRHDAIISLIVSRGSQPASAPELFGQLQNSYQNLRTLQRDLVELEKRGLLSRSDDGWVAGLDLRDDRFEDRARAAALRLLAGSFESAVPAEIQRSLRQPLAQAKRKLDALPPEDQRNRWLEAIRIVPGQHELDDPVIHPDIKDAVEDAILKRIKIRVVGRHSLAFNTSPEIDLLGSISHYLLEMPARPAIVLWPDGMNKPIRVRLQDIDRVELVDTVASWPSGYEPKLKQDGMGFDSGDFASHGGESKIVLRVSESAMQQLNRKRIGGRLNLDSVEGDGWTIVSFRAKANVPLYEYLKSLKGVVILRPSWFWKFAQLDHRHALRDYEQSLELVGKYKAEEDLELERDRSQALLPETGT